MVLIVFQMFYFIMFPQEINSKSLDRSLMSFIIFCHLLRSTKESIPSILMQEPLADVFSGNVVEWPNPLGIENKLIHRFF